MKEFESSDNRCPKCGLDFKIKAPTLDGKCLNCGHDIEVNSSLGSVRFKIREEEISMNESVIENKKTEEETYTQPGQRFFQFGFIGAIKDLILNPKAFFISKTKALLESGGLSAAFAFALICEWIGAFFSFFWKLSLGTVLEKHLSDLMEVAGNVFFSAPPTSGMHHLDSYRFKLMDIFFGTTSIILTPFVMFFKILFTTFFIHIAVRFLFKTVKDHPFSFSTTLKIICYSSAPAVLCFIPGIGPLAAYFISMWIIVVGLREVYASTTMRATGALIFPSVLLLGFILFFGLIFMLFGYSLVQLLLNAN